MVASKDQAKKISQVLRQGCKEFFEDFYAKAEKAGRHPHPLEAALAFGRILKQATEGEWPPPPPDRPGVSAEVFDLVNAKLPQEGYHEAVEAWYRHTPGLEIKKGTQDESGTWNWPSVSGLSPMQATRAGRFKRH